MILAVALLIAACEQPDFGVSFTQNEIAVKASTSVYGDTAIATKVQGPVSAGTFPEQPFIMSASYKNAAGSSSTYFTDITFSKSGDYWLPSSTKYWPKDGQTMFLAYSAQGLEISPIWDNNAGYAFSVVSMPDNRSEQADIMYAGTGMLSQSTGAATLTFHHAQSLLRFTGASNVAYDSSTNTGVTVTSITMSSLLYGGSFSVTQYENGTLAPSWSASTAGAATAYSGTGNLPVSAMNLGVGYMVYPQTPVAITVNYTLHNGKDASGNNADMGMSYTFTPSGSWAAGTAYTYAISFTEGEISVSASLGAWEAATQTWFYATADAVTQRGANFNFSSSSPMWWRASSSDSYEQLVYESGSWGSSVRFETSDYYVTVTAVSSNYTVAYETKRKPRFLTITAVESGTVTYGRTTYPIEYSLNDGDWTEYTTGIALNAGDSVKFRGNNHEWNGNASSTVFSSTGNFNASGNPLSIIDSENFESITDLSTLYNSGIQIFSRFFYSTKVVDASQLDLPAETLSNACFYYMFYNCTSLTKGPALPAKILTNMCYEKMFYNCRALTEVKMYCETIDSNSLGYWLYNLPDNVSFEFNLRCSQPFSTLSNNYSLNKTINWYCDTDVNSVSSSSALEMYNFFDEVSTSGVPVSATLSNAEVLDISSKMDVTYNENSLATYNNGVLRSTLATGTYNSAFSSSITINSHNYNVTVPLTVISRTPTNGMPYINGTQTYTSTEYPSSYHPRHALLSLGSLPITLGLTFDVGTLRSVTLHSSDGVTFTDVNGHASISADDQCSLVSSGSALFTAEINGLSYSGYFPVVNVTLTWTGATAISGASTAAVGTTLSADSGYTWTYEVNPVDGFYLSTPDWTYSFAGRYTSYFTGSWNKTKVSFKKTGSGPSSGWSGVTAYAYVYKRVKYPPQLSGSSSHIYDYSESQVVNLRR